MIDNKLIEKALSLTGKTMEGISDIDTYQKGYEYSIEKFCYYLLSPEFMEKYADTQRLGKYSYMIKEDWVLEFGMAIYEYQKGEEQPLIELLSKIGN